MKKIKVVELSGLNPVQINDRLNAELVQMQREGKEVLDCKIVGAELKNCAVFIFYDEDLSSHHHDID